MYTVLLYYKYVHIDNPQDLVAAQKALCKRLDLKGRIIVAQEGINGTLEGKTEAVEQYITECTADSRFADVHFKKSAGTGTSFPKLSVKLRSEIVSGHLSELDVDPTQTTGTYITAEQLHEWIHSGKEFYIVDMRNDYEQESGYFEGSILPGMENFRDLKKVLPKFKHLKEKTVVTVCTGGVRCEKASGFLVKNGFRAVYQLYGGIVTYMEKYPNQDFKGKLYVFDNRITMGFNTESPDHETVGRCATCGTPSDDYINCIDDFCHRHFICCLSCQEKYAPMKCPMGCRDYTESQKYLLQQKTKGKEQKTESKEQKIIHKTGRVELY